MALQSNQYTTFERLKSGGQKLDWRQSILRQLQLRKSIEQLPFEDIYTFANDMFGRLDMYKTENIQLNLQRQQLQQELLNIQQALLAGGTNAAKTILSKLSTVTLTDDIPDGSSGSIGNKNFNIQHSTLLAEKAQLEKKILDLQEKLTDALKSKSDTVQRVVDLKTELDEKNELNRHLSITLEQKERELAQTKETLEALENSHKISADEYNALTLLYKSLEKKHSALQIECNSMRMQILTAKQEDAERLNDQNAVINKLQQEKLRRELEANVHELNQRQLAKQAAGDSSALTLAAMEADNFENQDYCEVTGTNIPSKIPGGIEFTFDGHESETLCVHWYCFDGPKDDYLATGGSDRKVKIWRIANQTSTPIATLVGSSAGITSIDVDSDAILASSNDMATRVWSIKLGYKPTRTLTGHSAKVLSAKFLGSPFKIVSGSFDRTIKIWDLVQGSCSRTYFAGSSCNDVVYSDYQIITGHLDGKIRCWDLNKPKDNEFTAQTVLQAKITSLDISRDGTKLLCSLRDNTVKCLDLRRMEVVQTYTDDKFRIGTDACRAKFSPDGQLVACGSSDGSIYIWNANNARLEKVLTGLSNTVYACCWSPDGKRMVSGDKGKKVSILV